MTCLFGFVSSVSSSSSSDASQVTLTPKQQRTGSCCCYCSVQFHTLQFVVEVSPVVAQHARGAWSSEVWNRSHIALSPFPLVGFLSPRRFCPTPSCKSPLGASPLPHSRLHPSAVAVSREEGGGFLGHSTSGTTNSCITLPQNFGKGCEI